MSLPHTCTVWLWFKKVTHHVFWRYSPEVTSYKSGPCFDLTLSKDSKWNAVWQGLISKRFQLHSFWPSSVNAILLTTLQTDMSQHLFKGTQPFISCSSVYLAIQINSEVVFVVYHIKAVHPITFYRNRQYYKKYIAFSGNKKYYSLKSDCSYKTCGLFISLEFRLLIFTVGLLKKFKPLLQIKNWV